MSKTIETTQGLAFLDEGLKDTAEEFYEDERVEKILSADHTPSAADIDLIGDMIAKLNSL